MQVREAIILAGGLGIRLQSEVPNLPKCMAPVNHIPFIAYVVKHLQQQGIQRFIFSLGFRSEAFTEYISKILPDHNFQLAIENEPLGTGGAIQFAGSKAILDDVLVVNGDSIFKSSLAEQANFHFLRQADCTLALKEMKDMSRYGVVELSADNKIISFKEKQFYSSGLINGGVYMLNLPSLKRENLPEKFSFETDYLQKFYNSRKIFGIEQEGYFIDIGIPEDYRKAQTELNY
jgi:D-glycero-alpha-D-manno-heptose 1-phosphate guanylyltransferase